MNIYHTTMNIIVFFETIILMLNEKTSQIYVYFSMLLIKCDENDAPSFIELLKISLNLMKLRNKCFFSAISVYQI